MTEIQARANLRRWAAGKHITKAQLQDLKEQGLITTLEDGQNRLTVHGTRLITGKDPKQ
jgi:ribosomal protein S19E (S16A)